MTALLLSLHPHFATIAPKLRKFGQWFAGALDAFAESRMRGAIPKSYLDRIPRDIDGADPIGRPNPGPKRATRRASSLVSPIAH